jgi:serine/threonine protein kinase
METPPTGAASMGVPWVVTHGSDNENIRPISEHPGYRLDRMVGVGGMGEVWEATQESLGRKVAIKKIKAQPTTNAGRSVSQMLSRSFLHEALITACLDHPNIVPVYDIGRDRNGEPLLAMKLVRGMSWDDLLKADRALPFQEQLMKHLPILVDVAHAVAFAHSRGVLHRDIKPSQVMVGEFGEVLLLDWGVACYFTTGDHLETEGMFASDNAHAPVPLMKAMNPAGTPSFMAPEQTLSTPEGLGTWTDVFLLGATLYYLLAGRAPYGHAANSRAASALAAECRWESLESLSTEDRRIPPELIRICARAMAKNPWERHGSVNEFVQEVQTFLKGSGRRRESMELSNKALEVLNHPGEGYSAMVECNRLLTTARAIWEENPQIDELEELLHERFANVALERGDLALAREEAQRLPEGKRRQTLMATIARREDVRRRLPRERLVYGILSIVLLLAAVGSLLVALNLWRVSQGRGAAPKVALGLPGQALLERQALEARIAHRTAWANQ